MNDLALTNAAEYRCERGGETPRKGPDQPATTASLLAGKCGRSLVWLTQLEARYASEATSVACHLLVPRQKSKIPRGRRGREIQGLGIVPGTEYYPFAIQSFYSICSMFYLLRKRRRSYTVSRDPKVERHKELKSSTAALVVARREHQTGREIDKL
jgi:hypothetical protein